MSALADIPAVPVVLLPTAHPLLRRLPVRVSGAPTRRHTALRPTSACLTAMVLPGALGSTHTMPATARASARATAPSRARCCLWRLTTFKHA